MSDSLCDERIDSLLLLSSVVVLGKVLVLEDQFTSRCRCPRATSPCIQQWYRTKCAVYVV